MLNMVGIDMIIRFGLPVYDDKTGNLDRYNIFTAILLIKHSEDGNKYLHDITTIKKETVSSFV